MVREDIIRKFNLGIPCYNHVFMPLQDLTSYSYIKGVGNKAIDSEKELRYEGNKLLFDTDESLAKKINYTHNDGIFHYVSLVSNKNDSMTDFGFLDDSKLCSVFYPLLNWDCVCAPYNIDDVICNKVSSSDEENALYKEKDSLLDKDFSELERKYFSYLETNKVVNNYLSKLCECVLFFIKRKRFDIAQSYLFTLSAYLKVYGETNVKINGNNESLRGFINTICEKYPLKNEHLLRSGFINKSKEENDEIIDTIMSKTDIILDHKLCPSGYKKHTSTGTGIKREETTLEDIIYISKVLNDRMMFYLSLKPIGEIKPSGAFDKYGAYIYQNGIIVADRLYDVNTIGSLSKDAIYKFNALNFEERRILSKTALTNIPGSKFYHTDTWKERVKAYIESETSLEMKEKALELIKKH